ncbi:MAG: hypothetical protein MMC23_000655 [Stictis urceolatum]|nr:hypothetical protein [Stictis urceolata]
MRFQTLFSLLLALAMAEAQQFFNLTAISAAGGNSTIECWQLSEPLTSSSDAGTSGTVIQRLGDVSNATYTVLPAKFDGGLHRAPVAQYVAFISGLAHVTLPTSKTEAYIEGGKNGLIIAADTADLSTQGHGTNYPGKVETVALQIPFKDGKIPAHKVLYSGPCKKCDLSL